jgi:hypothetical protein
LQETGNKRTRPVKESVRRIWSSLSFSAPLKLVFSGFVLPVDRFMRVAEAELVPNGLAEQTTGLTAVSDLAIVAN